MTNIVIEKGQKIKVEVIDKPVCVNYKDFKCWGLLYQPGWHIVDGSKPPKRTGFFKGRKKRTRIEELEIKGKYAVLQTTGINLNPYYPGKSRKMGEIDMLPADNHIRKFINEMGES